MCESRKCFESGMSFLHSMRPFIDGVTLIMWAWATWWIPLLLLFGIWKHGICPVPLTYTPMFWSLVFPLGMYALAIVARYRFSAAQIDIACDGVGSACSLGHDRFRLCLRLLAKFSRVDSIGVGHAIELTRSFRGGILAPHA